MIGIDAYNTLYQFLATIRDRMTGEPLRDSHGRVTSHLSGLFYRTLRLMEAGIRPVFVFDGKPPAWKTATLDARKGIKQAAEVKLEEARKAGDVEKIRTYAQAASRLTAPMVQESKELLTALGVPWIQAPSEGEAQATQLLKDGSVWAVGSQDWDSLLFGAERVVRNLTVSGRKKVAGKELYTEVVPELVQLKDVLAHLNITHHQLILLGILIGTDYNPGGVQGVGPKTALKLVKEHPMAAGLQGAVEWTFPMSIQELADFFETPLTEKAEIPKARLDAAALRKFMVDEHSFSAERTDSAIQKLLSKPNQSRLGSFLR